MLLSLLKTRGDNQTFLCFYRIVALYRHLQAYVNLAKKNRNCLDQQKNRQEELSTQIKLLVSIMNI
jgi:hypothetical protein